MKRLASLFLILSLLLSLSACSGLSLPGSVSEKPSGGILCSPDLPSTPDLPDAMAFYDDATGKWDDDAMKEADTAYSAYMTGVRTAADAYDSSDLSAFYRSALPLLLPEGEDNALCSPLNIYLALAMLAEITDGTSRSQILSAVGAETMDSLAAQVGNIWSANYRNGDTAKSLLASSVWLKDGLSFRQTALDRLADLHRASAYSGEPGSDAMDQALRRWMNDATGNLLTDQIDRITLPKDLVAALVTALYYKAPWMEGFSREVSYQGDFTASSGETVTASYLFESRVGSIYDGEGFTAASKTLLDESTMWFLLPDEGVSTSSLLSSGSVTDLLYGSVPSGQYLVRLSVPEFDVTAHLDLMPVLAALGITDVADASRSDFSPLIDDPDRIALTSAVHGARLKLDEDGVEAAAYTMMVAAAGAIETQGEYDFVLDRPFVFALTSQAGDLLFAGTVGNPAA